MISKPIEVGGGVGTAENGYWGVAPYIGRFQTWTFFIRRRAFAQKEGIHWGYGLLRRSFRGNFLLFVERTRNRLFIDIFFIRFRIQL